ncbi:MAG: N-acetyltransferase family protein [Oscillospiraceae bacterium]
MIGAMSAGRVAFITAKRLGRPVGLCSVSRCFSSLTCWDKGVLDDFYIEPAFRGRGVARLLVEKAAEYCRKQGIQSLAVTGSDADIELYRALGFKTRLGTDLAMLLPYES